MNLHRLDLVSLSLFSLVVRTGSISRGAELAHLAVGAASKRISDLEAAVGAELFDRHSRGVTLTPAGQALQRHAQRILSDVDQLAADLSDHAKGVVGVVRLWANTSAITQFLPADLASFIALHPGIRIEMHEHNSSDVVLAVADGRADLGLFAERTPALGLQTLPYRSDRLVLVVPQGHALAQREAIAFAEAADFDFVSLAQDTSLAQRLALETRPLGKALRIRIHVRSFDAMCQMVAAGLGVAVLPNAAVQPLVRALGLRMVAISDPWVERQLLIGARDWGVLPRPVRTLRDHLLGARGPGGVTPDKP
ncbi:LysR family transcriptional regulator [Ramlibacter tataouinensis]|uniref:Transcriptional regulator, LysR family-like protein n=1 Tax=Ramlibacter tataouinensis (strain ATCC BAA-407 / DSM 14655 / LMG 21543 / TTB310) TaxID=365046 RepID=F5XYV5_RAMTT|nr:LysR substrate-binding domain-containing protein [Ramlibacter tataouinensis]AEG91943.1 transcriptional regulator, LysR family-like protein [Ramlibacter tataouinensis TTB310]